MKKLFKLWFIPIILVSSIVGMLMVEVPPMFNSFSPTKQEPYIPEDELVRNQEGYVVGRKMDDGMVLLLARPDLYTKAKRKIDYAMNRPINTSALSGAVIGWVICKLLDSGLIIIRKKIKNEKRKT